jgi:hypothetical protein
MPSSVIVLRTFFMAALVLGFWSNVERYSFGINCAR